MEDNNVSFHSFFTSTDGDHPEILKWFLRKEVSVETVLILDSLLSFMKRLDKELEDDIVWKIMAIYGEMMTHSHEWPDTSEAFVDYFVAKIKQEVEKND